VVNHRLCYKPDDGSNDIWLIVHPVTGVVDATFYRVRDKCELKLHSHVGTTFWTSSAFDYIADKWIEFKEVHK
jgi:hypothetical protein